MTIKKLIFPLSSIAILASLTLFSHFTLSAPFSLSQPNPTLGSSWVRDFVAQNPEYQDMPIASRTEKSITFQRSNGQLVTQSVDFPIHYKDEKGNWQPLDTTLKYFPETGEWGAPGFSTRIRPNGEVSIKEEDGGIFNQKTTSYGNLNSETGEFFVLGQFEEGSANGDALARKSGNIEHKIKLTDLGVKEEMIIPELPAGISETDYLVMQTELGYKQLFPDGWLEDGALAEFRFPGPFSFDTNQKPIPTKRYARYSDGIQYVFTGVEASDLSDSQFPVTVDPDYAEMTADGYVLGTATSYSISRSTSSTYNADDQVIIIGQNVGTDDFEVIWYYVWRSFLKFDTAGIPDNDIVTQVNLKMVCTSNMSHTAEFDIQIVKQDWSENEDLSNETKREAAFDGCLSGTADNNIWQNTTGMSQNIQYSSGNLSTSWMNKSGYTYYCLRSSRDHNPPNGTSAAGNEMIWIASQDHPTSNYRPVLTILHAPPPPDSPHAFLGAFKVFGSLRFW